MAVLKVIRGQEFKVRVEDKIDDNNIFKNEYDRAGQMLDSILMAKNHSENIDLECENNVIAFCGERGDGKTSAMLTFMNVHKDKFVKQIVIDPSLFDNVHNILDIVLAELFADFRKIYENDNQKIDSGHKEDLLEKFQKVYRQISLINNQTKILDSEYDYEGDIGKLEKLGESTQLKKELAKLIEIYADMKLRLDDVNGNSKASKCKSIIIGIDDLDLCSENAYKMSEEIRKYLVIPGVVIVMAIRVEQLELCVREKSIRDFVSNINYIKSDNEGLQTEVTDMARRYVEKLIPLDRRIYLTKAQDLTNLTIQFEEDKEEKDSTQNEDEGQPLVDCVLRLIRDKTDIIFRPNDSGSSFLIPTNLRGIVNLIALLRDMADDEKLKNLDLLRSYFINEWKSVVKNNEIDFEEINNAYLFEKNACVINTLSKLVNSNIRVSPDENDNLSDVVKRFVDFSRKPYEYLVKKNVYKVSALYTFTLNRILLENNNRNYEEGLLGKFINGFIWKDLTDDVIPFLIVDNIAYKRARFDILLDIAYKTVRTCLTTEIVEYEVSDEENEDEDFEITPTDYEDVYNPILGERASAIQKNYIEIWFMLGLLLNTKNPNGDSSNGTLIPDNRMYNYNCQVSVENFIVGLASLDLLPDKINIDMLTKDSTEIDNILEKIKKKNHDTIHCAQIIVSNMDIAVGILEYCKQKNDYKRASSNNFYRTMNLIRMFFDNMKKYLEINGINTGNCDFNTLYVPFKDKLGKTE